MRNECLPVKRIAQSKFDYFDGIPSKPKSSHRVHSQSLHGVRINKCILGLSRRAADHAIADGKVTINGISASCGSVVNHGDIVQYLGKVQGWEELTLLKQQEPSTIADERDFVYLKYWKPLGVTCTSDLSVADNIITAGRFSMFPQRIFTVGRLDKDSTGLILLTSDGRVNNAMLNQRYKKEKVYIVELDRVANSEQIEKLSKGVIITTPIQREGYSSSSRRHHFRGHHDNENSIDKGVKTVTAKTLPCYVKRIGGKGNNIHAMLNKTREDTGKYNRFVNLNAKKLEFTLIEGRNRQIRRMAEAVGLRVVSLHRISFAGIRLKGLAVGEWLELNSAEMTIIQEAIRIPSKTAEDISYK